MAKDKDIINEDEPKDVEESIRHEPYRPPSFQDYSSDSAKALFAKYEGKKSSIPTRLPTPSKCRKTRSMEAPTAESSNEKSSKKISPPSIRKTRSLDPPPTTEEPSTSNIADNEILKGVTAYVEARSKNENRSDVVIGQLRALGGVVEQKLGMKCTHVIFKGVINGLCKNL